MGQTVGWFKKDLKERSITRDLKFGTPVPLNKLSYEDKVIYDWFDVPIGYLSITAEYTDKWRNWWQPHDHGEVQLSQFIGKDHVLFHYVLFSATQIAAGDNWTKVHHLSTTEYLQYEGAKLSKSRGIGVDTGFTWDTFISANNRQLNNNLGNFINRVVKFVNKPRPEGYGGIVLDGSRLRGEDGSMGKWEENINTLLGSYLRHLDSVELRGADHRRQDIYRWQ